MSIIQASGNETKRCPFSLFQHNFSLSIEALTKQLAATQLAQANVS